MNIKFYKVANGKIHILHPDSFDLLLGDGYFCGLSLSEKDGLIDQPEKKKVCQKCVQAARKLLKGKEKGISNMENVLRREREKAEELEQVITITQTSKKEEKVRQ